MLFLVTDFLHFKAMSVTVMFKEFTADRTSFAASVLCLCQLVSFQDRKNEL